MQGPVWLATACSMTRARPKSATFARSAEQQDVLRLQVAVLDPQPSAARDRVPVSH